MIYIDNDYLDAAQSFALEFYLTDEKKLPADCVFMLWRNRPTLMVGKYQNTLQEINDAYAKQHGIAVYRRLSGGGTIYTDMGGFQYTFITPGDANEISFTQYISPVIGALRALGVEAGFNGRNDLVIAGRKFSGSAQYKHGGYTVHHGSLLFDTDIEQMVRSTTVDAYKIVSKGIASVRERVTNIAEHLPAPMDPADFRAYMVRSICGAAPCETYALTPADRARVEQIADGRFRTWAWNYGESPRCNIERSERLPGGKVEWKLQVDHGTVTACSLYGDFFCSMDDVGPLCRALVGCPYREEDLRRVLQQQNVGRQFYHITAEDLLHTLI
ncbi:MAG: lipoate--protein ligase [Clostridia bacterium]|nr:lipoate--protein ligase [Clostridia bacterium]